MVASFARIRRSRSTDAEIPFAITVVHATPAIPAENARTKSRFSPTFTAPAAVRQMSGVDESPLLQTDWWYSSAPYANTGASNASTSATNNAGAGSGATYNSVTVVDASGNTTTHTTLTGYEVRVESPVGVEFYVDGSYMGITPTSFVKVSGQHTVTLSKEGYQTKSYNLFIDDAQSDKTYAFPALVPNEE